MNSKCNIEVFSAGCPVCEETVALVKRLACPDCTVSVLDMHEPQVAKRAKSLAVKSLPAMVVAGELAACCKTGGLNEADLREAGVSRSL